MTYTHTLPIYLKHHKPNICALCTRELKKTNPDNLCSIALSVIFIKDRTKEEGDEYWSMLVDVLWTSEAWQKYVSISVFPGVSLYLAKPYRYVFNLATDFSIWKSKQLEYLAVLKDTVFSNHAVHLCMALYIIIFYILPIIYAYILCIIVFTHHISSIFKLFLILTQFYYISSKTDISNLLFIVWQVDKHMLNDFCKCFQDCSFLTLILI